MSQKTKDLKDLEEKTKDVNAVLQQIESSVAQTYEKVQSKDSSLKDCQRKHKLVQDVVVDVSARVEDLRKKNAELEKGDWAQTAGWNKKKNTKLVGFSRAIYFFS